MLVLVLVGLVAGLVTGLSPCVLPVLPGVLAASALPGGSATVAAPSRSRPYLVVTGLVGTFTAVTLLAAWLVAQLDLPSGLLRTLGILALVVVGLGLLVPPIGRVLERPFARIGRLQPRRDASAVAFGAILGLVFVPCAGPVLAAITVVAATRTTSLDAVVLAAAFALGIAVPLLLVAVLGQQAVTRISGLRRRLPVLRQVSGAVLVAMGVAIAVGLADRAAVLVPDYVASVQLAVEDNATAQAALADVTGMSGAGDVPAAPAAAPDQGAPDVLGPETSFLECEADPSTLGNCGPARDLVGIQQWLNTDAPLSLTDLRGSVVLLDFWTFGCINCQRTQPYLNEWHSTYGDRGLRVVGIHSPEFDHERDVSNVRNALLEAGIRYPVALDNDFRTWREWSQRFWPARYLIDRRGTVRLVHYGEGAYEETENAIQAMLAQPSPTPSRAAVGE